MEIVLDPGAPVRVTYIELRGLASLPKKLVAKVRQALKLQVGEIRSTNLTSTRSARTIESMLANERLRFCARRRASHTSQSHAKSATLSSISVSPGQEAVIGDVQIEGLQAFDRRVVLGKLALDPEHSASRVACSIGLVGECSESVGVFSSVQVKPMLDHPDDPRVPMRGCC